MLVSVASAVLPARRASKVPPVAALRDVAFDRSGTSKRRAAIGSTITGLGVAAMAAGLFGGAGLALVGLGAATVFMGVAVLGPILARPISRVLGAPLPRLRGMPGTLARENAMRNPKRTSTTAAALMIGVALVGFITILAASTQKSVEQSVERTFTGDLVVSLRPCRRRRAQPSSWPPTWRRLPEIEAATGFRMAAAESTARARRIDGVDPTPARRICWSSTSSEGRSPTSDANRSPSTTTSSRSTAGRSGVRSRVEFAETGVQQLRLAAIFSEKDAVGEYFVGLDTYEANVADQFDSQSSP